VSYGAAYFAYMDGWPLDVTPYNLVLTAIIISEFANTRLA
jgi:hypothetical protein